MKIYKTLKAELSYQNCGSVWLMVIRGPQKDIELLFNCLFNNGATNGQLDFTTGCKTVAKFWSSEAKMWQYFYNRHFSLPTNGSGASNYADRMVQQLRGYHVNFLDFHRTLVMVDGMCIGVASAEKPDNNIADSFFESKHKESLIVSTKVESPVAT
jgi:hypothetical protein